MNNNNDLNMYPNYRYINFLSLDQLDQSLSEIYNKYNNLDNLSMILAKNFMVEFNGSYASRTIYVSPYLVIENSIDSKSAIEH